MNVELPETLVIIESIVYKSNGFAIGNGTVEASDFEAGVLLSSVDVSSSSAGDILSFDVTGFVNQRVSNGDTFAGFGIRTLNLGSLALERGEFSGTRPRLI